MEHDAANRRTPTSGDWRAARSSIDARDYGAGLTSEFCGRAAFEKDGERHAVVQRFPPDVAAGELVSARATSGSAI